jgi:DNA-binding NtrC family response regulator
MISQNASAKPKVFIVDDDNDVRKLVCRWLHLEGYDAISIDSGEECLKKLNIALPVCILLDRSMPTLSGVNTLKEIKKHHPFIPVIMMTADVEVDSVVTSMQTGAFDYLAKPLERIKLLATLRNAIEKHKQAIQLRGVERENKSNGYERLTGKSAKMRNLFKQLDSISSSNISVLIQGASGTGKELVAQAIHTTSSRKDGPFVALNCAAIPETLHESELFGYEKGAFTGATSAKMGKFEQAHNGTLFLDEVGEMSLSLQAKLLRVLQERSFQKLGASKELSVDFRLITASHVDLAEAVKNKLFRDDLYFRLAVFELEIPTLAERKDDIPLICDELLAEFSRETNKQLSISDEVYVLFQSYSFPGNVRELKNALHRASVVCQDGLIRIEDLPKRIVAGTISSQIPENVFFETTVHRGNSIESLEVSERRAIEQAIKTAGGNMSEAVRRLGIGRATLYRKLKKFNISQ